MPLNPATNEIAVKALHGRWPGKAMHRRTLLFFTLFVVTAWFYAGVTDESTQSTTATRQQSVQMFHEVEEQYTDGSAESAGKDRG